MKTTELISLDQALALTPDQTFDLHRQYGNTALADTLRLVGFDQVFYRASGCSVYDRDGNRYLDFKGGYGALNVGHNHPCVEEAIAKVTNEPNLLQASLAPIAGALHHNLAMISPGKLQHSFFCNSGAEANEGAIKTARKYTGRSTILYTRYGFHGKTYGALSVTGNKSYQTPFGPGIGDCVMVNYDDLTSLRLALRCYKVAAFIVEPIQGEGGIKVPESDYLREVERLCRESGALLIVDEVQTGFGRTGTMFACQQAGIEPDIMTMAKSLGGGVMPIGAFITSPEIWQNCYGSLDTFALHTSTTGGMRRSCAAGIATIEIIQREKLCQAAAEKGQYILLQLRRIQEKYPYIVRDVRGVGLLIGIELGHWAAGMVDRLSKNTGSQLLGSLIASELLQKHRVITVYTLNRPNVIRIEPPLMVSYAEIDHFLCALEAVLAEYRGFVSLARKHLGNPAKLQLALRLMTG